MAVKTKKKNMEKWVEGIILTIFEKGDPMMPVTCTSMQMLDKIDQNYADDDWKNMLYMTQFDIVSRAMTRLTRRKFLQSNPANQTTYYTINPDYVFAP